MSCPVCGLHCCNVMCVCMRREVTSDTLGYFVHIQPSTLLTRALQAPAPVSVPQSSGGGGGGEGVGYRSRESICCPVLSPSGETLLHCNSADDPRYVVTASAGVSSQQRREAETEIQSQSQTQTETETQTGGLVLYTKRVKSSEFEVLLCPPGQAGGGTRATLRTGQVVEVLRRVHLWAQVRATQLLQPESVSAGTVTVTVTGWVELFTHMPPPAHTGASPTPRGSNYGYVANLVPLKTLEHARHGQARPFASSCGHAIHAHCWDTYMASSLSSYINSRGYGATTVNPDIGEVCRAVC
jgi:hypothetical protein